MKHVSANALATALEVKEGDGDDATAIVTKAIETLTASVESRVKPLEEKAADAAKLGERLDKIEARLNRPGADDKKNGEDAPELKAFGKYLRGGDKSLTPDEAKTLRVAVDPQGGYLAPAEQSAEFIRNLVEFSPIRALASVRSTSAPSVIYPARTGVTNGKWKGELQTQEASEPAFGELEIVTKELNTFVDISNQLLADTGGRAEQEVRLALAEDFGAKEGTAFVNGDGLLAPEGFMTNANVGYTANGHASVLQTDALISLMYAVQSVYRRNGTWVMNGTTLAIVRKLKDGQGNYLWQPAYAAGQPETLLGRPIVEAIDMPDLTVNAFPIAFGDFNLGYRIVDRLDMSILVNPYLLATNGTTRIHATRRTGGGVIRPAAIRKLKISTT